MSGAARVEDAGDVGGVPVRRAVLENARGMRATVLSLGATLESLTAPAGPGGGGAPVHLALGFDAPADYVAKGGHLGATAGRFANRIRHGRFRLDGAAVQLATNENGHHLHGGPDGFGVRHWDLEVDAAGGAAAAMLALVSDAGDQGYPGGLEASCVIELRDDGTLAVTMTADADAPTPVNLVHHSYWNLAGGGTVYDHALELDADAALVTDADTVPTGAVADVAGTALDFRRARAIAADGKEPFLDHCFVLRPRAGLRLAARLAHPGSGRAMEVWANQPAIQAYSGWKLGTTGRGGVPYGPGAGLCLETEALPDAPNHPHFPSAILRPGEVYRHVMEHRFTLPD